MEIVTIKYFLSVAKSLNFSVAAEENNISQSSFSKAIMRLERDLGVKLIDRSCHPIALTPAGKCFYARMSDIVPQFENAIGELSTFSKGDTLRLLICPRSFLYKMAIEDFLIQEKGIQIQIDETSDITSITENVLSGKYDFVISPHPFDLSADILATELYGDTLYLLAALTSPLTANSSISLRDLDGQNFFEGKFSKLLVNELSRRFGFTPKTVYPIEGKEMRRQEAIHRISKNMGVGIYTSRDLRPYRNAHMVCLPIQEIPEFPVMLLERANTKDTYAKQRFRSWIIDNLEQYVPERLNVEKFNSKALDSDIG